MWRRIREFFLLSDLKINLILIPLALVLVLMVVLALIWSDEPELFDVRRAAEQYALEQGHEIVTGYVTAHTLREVASQLLEKPGGYLSNDVMPPSVFLDNIPNWEFGVVRQMRDLVRALRNHMSRSQTQSIEDEDLIIADPQFQFDTESWLFPPTEGEYRQGIEALDSYLARLTDDNEMDAQFFSRADNLRSWLGEIESSLGSLSVRLSASVAQDRVNVDLGGDRNATQATPVPNEQRVQTPWMEIDDVFYEARGACWALIHFLKAIEIDFEAVLEDKNAKPQLRQIIRELEATQAAVWSPVILNGSGFGFTANHSLVMASYISRANAALINLRSLLQQG